jgi:predicted phosphodiesterase
MRVFALSDVHVDHNANARWIAALSRVEYSNDVLILAGDISDSAARLEWCLNQLAGRFWKLLFIPGNHELLVMREQQCLTSMDKFHRVREIAQRSGAWMAPFHHVRLSIVPLQGWYDYSFGMPETELKESWTDFYACRWPQSWSMEEVASQFLNMNNYQRLDEREIIISFSHFLPRVDVVSKLARSLNPYLLPVLGTIRLEQQVRQLRSAIHVYGHSHINRSVHLDGTLYVNNALGYPNETHIASRQLRCVYEYPSTDCA